MLAVLLTLGAIALGHAWQQSLPLRTCSNCGAVVCRRCSERRREVALCPACAAVVARAETPDFGRVLLGQQKRRVDRTRRSARTAFASLVPGLGFALFHEVVGAVAIAALASWLVMVMLGVTPPFDARHDFGLAGPGLPAVVLLAAWAGLYGISILRYITRQSRQDAEDEGSPTRSRVAQATHRRAEAA
jgi:hypothetical protein